MGTIRLRFLGAVLATAVLAVAAPASAEQGAAFEILITKSNFALKEKNYEQALESAERALQLDPESPRALALKGRALVELGRTDEALNIYRDLEKKSPADDSWRLGYGIVLQKSGDTKGAISQLERALKADSKDGAAHYHLAYALYVDRQFKAAGPHFGHAIERGFNVPAAAYYRGRCAYETGNSGQAKADFQMALDKGAQGELAQKARSALELVQEFETAPAGAREQKKLTLKGRLGVAFDTNVLVSTNESATNPPVTSGVAFITKEDDFRAELELGLMYRDEVASGTELFGGYTFTGYYQFGHEDRPGSLSTSDFSLLNNNVSIGASHAYDSSNIAQLRIDYILSTLGRLGDTSGEPDAIKHEFFSHQLIATVDWLHAVSADMAADFFLQYSHDFRPEDPLGKSGIIPNGALDGDTFEPGVRVIKNLPGNEGAVSGAVSWFTRFNESTGFNEVASYTGPRFRITAESKIVEQLTLNASVLYAIEAYYADESLGNSKHRLDHRLIGTVGAQYDLTENVATSLTYRGELLESNLVAPFVPDYDRHVVGLYLLFQN